ncbi:MAG: response regulator [Burkholderiales bacterium]
MQTCSILYVEDNDDVRELIGMLLEGAARELVQCASGEAALAALAQRPFDILITDVSLPGLSGTELARRALAANPRQWVVLCSGYEFGQALHTLGPNVRSLPKPFEAEDLDALLSEIMTRLAAPAPRH